VNLVGLTAFGHTHHRSHGHTHNHDHDHNNSHQRDHSHPSEDHHSIPSSAHSLHDHSGHQNEADNLNSPLKTPLSPLTPQLHVHSNDNMQGIFLHILADALGSVSVIISTLLIKYNSWNSWDPLASCIIAVLIFFSAILLVKSSGS
jgi:solute carrier family 30 (zinc transporter), member 5/7